MGQASWPKSSRKGIGVYTPTHAIGTPTTPTPHWRSVSRHHHRASPLKDLIMRTCRSFAPPRSSTSLILSPMRRWWDWRPTSLVILRVWSIDRLNVPSLMEFEPYLNSFKSSHLGLEIHPCLQNQVARSARGPPLPTLRKRLMWSLRPMKSSPRLKSGTNIA